MSRTNICERCGIPTPDRAAFCPGCGARLADVARPRETRKVVTALFCDVTGSTALGEQLDPEPLRRVMDRYFSELRVVIERHGGTVEKFMGDAVMAVFGIPRVHEDDALRAVRAAVEIRDRLPSVAAETGVSLRFRTGVNTGYVLSGGGENLAIGDAVNVAARLEQAAAPGEILLGAETVRLVRDAVAIVALPPLELKGKAEPVPAFRLVDVDRAAPGVARNLEARLVGRGRELGLLRAAGDRSVRESGCHLFTVLGEAGVGKSRLVAELLARAGEASTILEGRCLPYGDGITFWPLVEALTVAGDPARHVLERLRSGGAATPEELFWEVRRLLESLARERALILHVDDLQWAEPMLLDLLDHVIELSRGVPILLVCTARPELLEERPGWGGGKPNATAVLLEPLGAADCEVLLDQLGDDLDERARAQIVAASEGNPLFLEEMVSLARDRGSVAVPPTIQALLSARIERLPGAERELLECGAIEGEVFHREAVRALAGATELDSPLAALERKELIRPHPPTLPGDDAFRFRHLLIRDAAYDALPKAARAELHERFARWLEDAGSALAELHEIAGWHLEQAVRYRRELGTAGEPALARRAAEYLLAAGRRARDRSDRAAARNLLERAIALAPQRDTLHAWISAELAEQLIETADVARLDELLSAAEQDPETAAHAALTRFEWLSVARPDVARHTISSSLPGMLAELEARGDERGLAKAHMAAFWTHWVRGHATPAGEEMLLAARHAEQAGDDGFRSRALGWYTITLLYGSQHAETVARELDAIERQVSGPYIEACVLRTRAEVARLEGDFAEAGRLLERAREGFEAIGSHALAALAWMNAGWWALLENQPARAVELLLRSDADLEVLGAPEYRSTTQALLAQAHEALGDRDAARSAIVLCEQLGDADDPTNRSITHGVRARLALDDGDGDGAERWARTAAEYAFQTEFAVFQGEAVLGLARVLAELGESDDATAQARRALEVYDAKGDRTGAERARALLAALRVRAEAPPTS